MRRIEFLDYIYGHNRIDNLNELLDLFESEFQNTFPARIQLSENQSMPEQVRIRIDDWPETSEHVLGGKQKTDQQATIFLSSILAMKKKYQFAEFALAYTPFLYDGNTINRTAELYPEYTAMLRENVNRGFLEVMVHGYCHASIEEWQKHRHIEPREFSQVNLQQSRSMLDQAKDEMVRVFGREDIGFVAPCWSYNFDFADALIGSLFLFYEVRSTQYPCVTLESLIKQKVRIESFKDPLCGIDPFVNPLLRKMAALKRINLCFHELWWSSVRHYRARHFWHYKLFTEILWINNISELLQFIQRNALL